MLLGGIKRKLPKEGDQKTFQTQRKMQRMIPLRQVANIKGIEEKKET